MKTVKVELELEDGTLMRLTGKDAEKYNQQTQGQATHAALNGARYPELPWEEIKPVSTQDNDLNAQLEAKLVEENKRLKAALSFAATELFSAAGFIRGEMNLERILAAYDEVRKVLEEKR